jgi:hypothetical protein
MAHAPLVTRLVRSHYNGANIRVVSLIAPTEAPKSPEGYGIQGAANLTEQLEQQCPAKIASGDGWCEHPTV